MKYYEAIDMILDGGEAYMKSRSPRLQLRFRFDDGFLMCTDNESSGEWVQATLNDYMVKKEDWVVEKDGVVYEEKPNGTVFIKSRIHEKDEPAELEEGGEPWEEIKMPGQELKGNEPINLEQPRNMQIDEAWLEKKVRCILRRDQRKNHGGWGKPESIKCGLNDCEFCFPQEQPKEPKSPWKDENLIDKMNECIQENCTVKPKPGHIPDTSKKVDEQFIEDHLGKMPENDHSEDVRERVAVDNIISLVGEIKNQWYWYGKKPCGYPLDDEALWKELEQKLQYLVGLQKENEELRILRMRTLHKFSDECAENAKLKKEIDELKGCGAGWYDAKKCLPLSNKNVIVKWFGLEQSGECQGAYNPNNLTPTPWALALNMLVPNNFTIEYILQNITIEKWRYTDE